MINETMQVSDVKINYDCQVEVLKFNQDEEDMIYRVVQESITNAIRHGKAKQIATVKNKIQGWTFHNNAIKRISHKVIPNIPTTNGKNSTFPVCISTDVF